MKACSLSVLEDKYKPETREFMEFFENLKLFIFCLQLMKISPCKLQMLPRVKCESEIPPLDCITNLHEAGSILDHREVVNIKKILKATLHQSDIKVSRVHTVFDLITHA